MGRQIIPDGYIPGVAISEVKNVARQGLTSQLRGYTAYALEHGLSFDLYVRAGADLSRPLRAMDGKGINIIEVVIPGL
jgi:hypothetical protein